MPNVTDVKLSHKHLAINTLQIYLPCRNQNVTLPSMIPPVDVPRGTLPCPALNGGPAEAPSKGICPLG